MARVNEARELDPGAEHSDQDLLCRRLKDAREYLGLSQEGVAEHLGIPRAAVSAIETGKRRVSSLELKKLAKLYRRDYNFFLESDEGREPAQDSELSRALFRVTEELTDM